MYDMTADRVKRIIAAYKSIPVESVRDEARLIEDLDIDSLGATEILFEIEDEFQIAIGDEVAHTIETVRDVADKVHELLTAR